MPERDEWTALLQLAREVIRTGTERGVRMVVDPATFPDALRRRQASFVTLTSGGMLRGCCGATVAIDTLVEDLARHAWRTAFDDPRFPPMSHAELAGQVLEISLLSPLRTVEARSREALISNLVPGVTGLLISHGDRRATFLPKVWESLPDPDQFIDHLRVKAGLSVEDWPRGLQAQVYTTESFCGSLDEAESLP